VSSRRAAASRSHAAEPGGIAVAVETSVSEIVLDRNILIPMRDGTCLAADCYRPAGDGPWPAVVSCYPYHKDGMIGVTFTAALKRFARHGYAALLVDCRGTGGSDGASNDALEAVINLDLYDLVEWIGRQGWCTGKVGMWGISYGGITALKAASLHPPSLAAIAPIYGVTDFEHTWLLPGGRPNLLGNMAAWMSFMQAMNVAPPLFRDPAGRWAELWNTRLADHRPYLLEGLQHLTAGDGYWKRGAIDAAGITTPTLVIAGWRDVFLDDCIEQFRRISAPKRLLAGPWVHMLPNVSVVEAIDHEHEILRWFDHWLRDQATGVLDEPAARVFVQGTGGGWRFDADFPPPATPRRLFLHDRGGLFAESPPTGDDHYTAVHAVGTAAGLWSPMPMGLDYPQDQRRDDALALSYTSAPLDGVVEIAGRPVTRLALTCSWDDPTVVVKLCDVAPDGASTLVTTGWLALRPLIDPTREPGLAGRRVEVEVPLWHTAYRFAAGHRVRLSVACADFPRLWPGHGTGSLTLHRGGCELRLPSVDPHRGPDGVPRFEPPDLMALFSEGPIMFVPSWRVETDVVHGTIATHAGLEMKFTTPTGAYLESRHEYAARIGTGERSDATVDAVYTLDILQAGDAVRVHAEERMTERTIELRSVVTVNGEERYRGEWQCPWQVP
jgi:putative CocE/NonD family hydrolase